MVISWLHVTFQGLFMETIQWCGYIVDSEYGYCSFVVTGVYTWVDAQKFMSFRDGFQDAH